MQYRQSDLIQRQRTAQMQSPWTPERVELLREMVAARCSAREIALRLQCGRGAVTGKCTRIGLQLRGKRGGARVRTRVRVESIEPAEPRALPLIELGPGECKWPITAGPPHLFCGVHTSENRVYCAWHCARAYRREAMCDEQ